MECKYKEFFTGDGKCALEYPDCMKRILCPYEDRYHDRLAEAKIAERERYERDTCETK